MERRAVSSDGGFQRQVTVTSGDRTAVKTQYVLDCIGGCEIPWQ